MSFVSLPRPRSFVLTVGLFGGALAALLVPAQSQAQAQVDLGGPVGTGPSVALRLSTFGLGAQVSQPLSDHFDARLVAQGFRYPYDRTFSGSTIDAHYRVKTLSGGLLFDYRPFTGGWANGLALTAGGLFQNNRFDGVGTCPGGCRFQNIQVLANNSARLTSEGYFRHRLAPYAGFGYDTSRRSTPGVTYGVELGALYQGRARSVTRASGVADIVDTSSGVAVQRNGVDLATDPTVQANVRRENRELEHTYSRGRFFPNVGFTVGYRY